MCVHVCPGPNEDMIHSVTCSSLPSYLVRIAAKDQVLSVNGIRW